MDWYLYDRDLRHERVNDQVVLFNETNVNIMSNFTPNETMIIVDRVPLQHNKNIKNIINYKNAIYKKLIHRNDSHLKLHLSYFEDLLHTKIEQAQWKSSLETYLISYRTKPATLNSTGHS